MQGVMQGVGIEAFGLACKLKVEGVWCWCDWKYCTSSDSNHRLCKLDFVARVENYAVQKTDKKESLIMDCAIVQLCKASGGGEEFCL